MISSFRIDNNGDFRLPFELVMIKQGLMVAEHEKVLLIIWVEKTKKGQSKSINCLDDILQLSESRKYRVQQIHSGNDDIHFGLLKCLHEIFKCWNS
ncbi:hypothetical protein F8M41_022464 [Gigaspora margarita]|uniref:Uncharacterized protein n=1 Tax=Gigaspora margarita TaxID=4874 RepID=A0A8H4AEX9_GIGMA|nr:hypothetical protein F8M41_022464 [Gigaspora margarita]